MDEKHELLVDIFFNRMHHNSAIDYPYYADPEYAHNIANDYTKEHPEFQIPPKDNNNSYIFSPELLQELKDYCDKRCEYYGYTETEQSDF